MGVWLTEAAGQIQGPNSFHLAFWEGCRYALGMSAKLKDVTPSATPTEAEIAAWEGLTPEEQLRRLREALEHPDCKTPSQDSMADILARAKSLAAERRGD
jgi:hypothetical protein